MWKLMYGTSTKSWQDTKRGSVTVFIANIVGW